MQREDIVAVTVIYPDGSAQTYEATGGWIRVREEERRVVFEIHWITVDL